MSVFDWLLRALGLGGPRKLCSLCRCDIPASDFHRGNAVIIARQSYCAACVEEITHRGGRFPGWGLAADHGSSSSVLLR